MIFISSRPHKSEKSQLCTILRLNIHPQRGDLEGLVGPEAGLVVPLLDVALPGIFGRLKRQHKTHSTKNHGAKQVVYVAFLHLNQMQHIAKPICTEWWPARP